MHFGKLDNYKIGDSVIRNEAVWNLSKKYEKIKDDDPVNNLIYGELTVPINVKGKSKPLWIESAIAPHVYLLNELGYKTLSCCAGHKECYLSSYDNKYISSGYIELTYTAIKSIIEQFSSDKKTSITLYNVIDLSDMHMSSSIKVYEYDNCNSLPTGILEWNVEMENAKCEDNKNNKTSSTYLFKSFEYALYQLRQWIFRHIILELKCIA